MKIFLPAAVLIFLSVSAAAQDGAAAALKGTQPHAQLARPFSITYSVPLPAGVKAQDITYDADTVNDGDFTILSYSSAQIGNTAEFTFRAVPFALGKTKFTAAWKLPDGAVIKARDVELDVSRVNTGIISGDIVDIRKPLKPFDWWSFILFLTIAGLIAVPLVWRYIVRKRSYAPAGFPLPPPDNRPANIAAKDKISVLLASDLWENKEYKIFYLKLVEIFREYLSARFNIYTDSQTTAELLRAIKKSEAQNISGPARQFLNSADMVKFAEVIPLTVERDEDARLLNAMIDETAAKSDAEEDKNGTRPDA